MDGDEDGEDQEFIEEMIEGNIDEVDEVVLENKYKGVILQGFGTIYWRRIYCGRSMGRWCWRRDEIVGSKKSTLEKGRPWNKCLERCRKRRIWSTNKEWWERYNGIKHSTLTQRNGNLILPFFGGNYPIFLLDDIY